MAKPRVESQRPLPTARDRAQTGAPIHQGRNPLVALIALIAMGIAVVTLWPRYTAPQADGKEIEGGLRSGTAAVLSPRPAPVSRIIAETERLNASETSPHEDTAVIWELIRVFRHNAKGNPVGDNDEITAQLLGRHPRSPAIALINPRSPAIDPQGQLVDRWGTPYFFHALSANHMEIRSAGPDRKMWTADDVVGDGE